MENKWRINGENVQLREESKRDLKYTLKNVDCKRKNGVGTARNKFIVVSSYQIFANTASCPSFRMSSLIEPASIQTPA